MNIVLILLALLVAVVWVLQLLKILVDQRIVNLIYGLALLIIIVFNGGWINRL